MNRANKKKVEAVEPASNEGDDPGDESEPDVPTAQEPEPSPSPDDSEPAYEHDPAYTWEGLVAQAEEAKHQLMVVNRRWRKTVLTYFNDNSEMRWATASELQRILERLQHADDEHDEAEDYYEWCRILCERFKTFRALAKQARAQPEDLSIAEMRDDARWALVRHRRSWLARGYPEPELFGAWQIPRPSRDLTHGQTLELLCEHVGLAKAYQWLPLSDLRLDLDPDYVKETPAQMSARAMEHSKEYVRKLVRIRLDQEKADPALRASRHEMKTWNVERAFLIDALREMGECLCCGPRYGSCEMCRADAEDRIWAAL